VTSWEWIGAGHVARQRIGGSRACFAGKGKESGGSHTSLAPDLAASQAPTCEDVVGMIPEMLVLGRKVMISSAILVPEILRSELVLAV
jgi:hypothetical protein